MFFAQWLYINYFNLLGQKQTDLTFYFHRRAKSSTVLKITVVKWYDYKNQGNGQEGEVGSKAKGAWGVGASPLFSRSLTLCAHLI